MYGMKKMRKEDRKEWKKASTEIQKEEENGDNSSNIGLYRLTNKSLSK